MKHVLVTDDDAQLRPAVVRMLKRILLDATIHEMKSPQDAIEFATKLLSEEGDSLELALVTDGNMVGVYDMDGDELIVRIREIVGPRLRGALMMSGRKDEWEQRSQEIGFRLIEKPFGHSVLREEAHLLFHPSGTST